MIYQGSSDIVKEIRQIVTSTGEPVELIIFANDLTLAVSTDTLAVYRRPGDFGDPLGNGLVGSINLPDDSRLHSSEGRVISTIQSGCVNLLDSKILLILPNEVRLYPDKESGLRNHNLLASLPLTN